MWEDDLVWNKQGITEGITDVVRSKHWQLKRFFKEYKFSGIEIKNSRQKNSDDLQFSS